VKLFNTIRTAAQGGPVGLVYALRLARNQRRIKDVGVFIDREKELHRAHMAQLAQELRDLVAEQDALNASAANYWSALQSAARQA
jgi:hypothetical protein